MRQDLVVAAVPHDLDALVLRDQRFLGGDYSPTFAVGSWHTVRIQQSGATMAISADGTTLGTVTDSERPYRSGDIGLYTEDARVHFDNASVTS